MCYYKLFCASCCKSFHKVKMEAFSIPNQEADTVAEKLVSEVLMQYGVSSQLHCDQGSQFESRLIFKVCKLLGIQKSRTMPYHPRAVLSMRNSRKYPTCMRSLNEPLMDGTNNAASMYVCIRQCHVNSLYISQIF